MNERFDLYFDGYDVPDKLKETAVSVMRRFSISGLTDGMYICNVIALESGVGDGQGHFTGDTVSNVDLLAQRLQFSYGSHIPAEDLAELKEILSSGKLDNEKAERGIKRYISACINEKKTCDTWRVDYLNDCIKEAEMTLREINQTMTYSPLEDKENLIGKGDNALPLFVNIVCADNVEYQAIMSTPKDVEVAFEQGGGYSNSDEPVWSDFHKTPDAPVYFTHVGYEFLVENISRQGDISAIYPSSKESFLKAYLEEHYGFHRPDLADYPKDERAFLTSLINNGEIKFSSKENKKDAYAHRKEKGKSSHIKKQDEKKKDDVSR